MNLRDLEAKNMLIWTSSPIVSSKRLEVINELGNLKTIATSSLLSLLILTQYPSLAHLRKHLYTITAVTLAAKDQIRVLSWLLSYVQSKNTFYSLGSGACFSRVPLIYGSVVIFLDLIQRNNNASLG